MSKNRGNKHQHGGHPKKPANTHNSSPEELAAINETFVAFSEKYEEANKKSPRRDIWKFRIEIITVIGVGIYTIITGGLLIAGLYQLRASRDQVKIMEDTEKRQLRAYVGVSAGDVEDFAVPDKQRIHFVRKNYGQTPAYDVGFSAIGTFVITPATGPFEINAPTVDCVKPGTPGLITMFPTVELPMTLNTQGSIVSDKDAENVKSGRAALVYFGSVCYHDAFGISHYTHYCFMHKGTSMKAKDADACLKYNDSN